jgi:hypothetical protein
VLEATLENETVIADLDSTGDTFEHPPDAAATYATFRHRKYMQKVRRSGEDDTGDSIAEAYADWACRQVAANRGQRVEQVQLYRIYQPSPINGTFEDTYEPTVIRHSCHN